MSTKDNPERQIVPLATVLQQVAKGTALARLSEQLADLTVAVKENEKPGTLTITIKVEPTKGTSENLTVSVTSTLKVPQETAAGIFFATDDGNLTREDPRQTGADIRAIGLAKTGEKA